MAMLVSSQTFADACTAASQLVLVDGYGVLHPRRCGSASHLGVVAGVASVGVAKNLLVLEGLDRQGLAGALALAAQGAQQGGSGAEEGGVGGGSGAAGGGGGQQRVERGTWQVPLVAAGGETLGMAVVLQGNTKPVFVSVGGWLAWSACLRASLLCACWLSGVQRGAQSLRP